MARRRGITDRVATPALGAGRGGDCSRERFLCREASIWAPTISNAMK